MGRGIAYQYKYHLLLDADDVDAGGDPGYWKDFLYKVTSAFGACRARGKWVGSHAYLFAETDRLSIGIDNGGDCSCLFVLPKTYQHNFSNEEVEYKIWRDVETGFNKLFNLYPGLFFYWTTAWTSSPYTQPYKAER